MRQRIVKILKPLHAISVENSCGAGTPDINTVDSWIECKQIKAWPKDPNAVVKVPHFTPQQRLWIKNRIAKGGDVQIVLKVGRDWIILTEWSDAYKELGKTWTKEDIIRASNGWYWEGKLDEEHFLSYFWEEPLSDREAEELSVMRQSFQEDLEFRTQ